MSEPKKENFPHTFPQALQDAMNFVPNSGDRALLQAINGLREDIRALRQDLVPTKSVILMGRDVFAEFKALSTQATATATESGKAREVEG
jgi:hypothetical protein